MRTIAIVGRPNVGKSALFNRLAGKNISIVHDQAGVTRDRISAVCRLAEHPFEIVDTGGIEAEPDPDFADETHFAADIAISTADLLIFLVDGPQGLTPVDQAVAERLRGSGKPVLLVVNKIDNARQENLCSDFTRLGLAGVLAVSAAHGLGIGDLVERIADEVDLASDEAEAADAQPAKVAVVGRPNVGKSSLINALLQDRRTIVSDIPGTTRDAIDIPYHHGGKDYVLVDTAGIRHRSKHNTSVEVFSVMRSENAIHRADLVILVIDASQGVTVQDKKIAGLIQKARKACVLVLNKWDLVEAESTERDAVKAKLDEIREGLFFVDYAPVVVVSAKDGSYLPRLFNMIEKVRQHATRKLGTGELNRIFTEAVERQAPPMRGSRRFKIFYATQVGAPESRPFGRIELLLFVNDPKKLSDSYTSYLLGRIRQHREYPGLPITLKLRARSERRGAQSA